MDKSPVILWWDNRGIHFQIELRYNKAMSKTKQHNKSNTKTTHKTACPATQRAALIEFMKDFPGCQVRDQKIAKCNPIPSRFEDRDCKEFSQLRSKKHDHLAVETDELGNQFVLTIKGQRMQLID